MKTSKLVVLLLSAVALTGCARGSGKGKGSLKKVTYEEFHEKALAAAENRAEAGYTQVKVTGSAVISGRSMTFNSTFDVKDGVVTVVPTTEEEALASSIVSMTAENIPEDELTNYYAGTTFKITINEDGQKGEALFDKYDYQNIV